MNEFSRLVDAWLDGEITEPEIARLNDYLGENPSHLSDFAQQVRLHYQLRKAHFLESSLTKAAAGDRNGVWADAGESPSHAPAQRLVRTRTRAIGFAALAVTAVTLMVALSPRAWQRLWDDRPPVGISAAGASVSQADGKPAAR